MSNSLVVNSSNVIGSYNNTYQYKFIQGSFQSKDCEMAIGSATIPYSWYNISSLYGNNKMTINFPYLATTYTMAIHQHIDVELALYRIKTRWVLRMLQ